MNGFYFPLSCKTQFDAALVILLDQLRQNKGVKSTKHLSNILLNLSKWFLDEVYGGHLKSTFAHNFEFLIPVPLLFVPIRFTCTPPPSEHTFALVGYPSS